MLKSTAKRFVQRLKPAAVKKPEKNQWVTVGISFILAVTLWFLVTLNTQSFSRYYSIPVKLANFPESLQLTKEFPYEIRVLAKGVGIELLYQQVEPEDTLIIDFNEYRGRGAFISSDNYGKINQVLQPNLSIVRARPDTIPLGFLHKSNKRVPIELDLELTLPPSYRIVGELRSAQDSVYLIGPEESLAHITSWKTTRYRTPLLTKKVTLSIAADTVGGLQVVPDFVDVTIDPIPFTERTMSVAINKMYVPRDTLLNLDTDSISISFLLPMEEYDQISAADFRVDADFRSLNLRSDYLIPTLMNKPQNVTIQNVTPKLVRYTLIYQD